MCSQVTDGKNLTWRQTELNPGGYKILPETPEKGPDVEIISKDDVKDQR